jgi:hypothetical protein
MILKTSDMLKFLMTTKGSDNFIEHIFDISEEDSLRIRRREGIDH